MCGRGNCDGSCEPDNVGSCDTCGRFCAADEPLCDDCREAVEYDQADHDAAEADHFLQSEREDANTA